MEMTIDEAIAHAEWAAANCEGECAEEHRQLAEWLKELATLKAENERLKTRLEILKQDGIEIADAVAGGYEIYDKHYARAVDLEWKNEKLHELLKDIRWFLDEITECRCKGWALTIEEYKRRMQKLEETGNRGDRAATPTDETGGWRD